MFSVRKAFTFTGALVGGAIAVTIIWGSPIGPIPLDPVDPRVEVLEVDYALCSEPDRCVFDVVGVDGVLGKNISVTLLGFSAPQYTLAFCDAEREQSQKSARYLIKLMRESKKKELRSPVKLDRRPMLYAHLYLDGQDVAPLMIKSGHGMPYREDIKYWCNSAFLEASLK